MATSPIVTVILVCIVFIVTCPPYNRGCENGMDILKCASFFRCQSFLEHVNNTGLWTRFLNARATTVFLPSDVAFKSLPPEISSDTALMKEIILYHALPQTLNTYQMTNEQLLPSETTGGQAVRFNTYSRPNTTIMTSSGVIILVNDQNATNGLINLVAKVMYPLPTGSLYDYVVNSGSYQTLLLLAAKARFLDTLKAGNLTLFAPNDEAFSKLPAGIIPSLLENIPKLRQVLDGHLVHGTMYSVGLQLLGGGTAVSGHTFTSTGVSVDNGNVNATITSPDHSAINGVLHDISSVLL